MTWLWLIIFIMLGFGAISMFLFLYSLVVIGKASDERAAKLLRRLNER